MAAPPSTLASDPVAPPPVTASPAPAARPASSQALRPRRGATSRTRRRPSGEAPAPEPQSAVGLWLRRALRGLPAVTPEGQVVAFLMMSTSTILIVTSHPLVYLVLAVGLALMTVGFVWPYLNLAGLSFRRQLPPSAFAGEPVYVELAVANRRKTASYALVLGDDGADGGKEPQVHVPMVRGGQVARVGYHARFARRGRYRLRYIRIQSSFPFSLFSRNQLIRYTDEILIYPRPGVMRRKLLPEPRGSLQSARRNERGGQAFHGLREYREGEDARLIHWKSSLRRQRPLVREFDIEEGTAVLVVLDPGIGGSASRLLALERAISLAVTLVRDFWRQGYRVTFACHGEAPYQAMLARRPQEGFREVLATLATYQPGEATLADLLAGLRLGAAGKRMALALVSGRDGCGEEQAQALWSGARLIRVDVDMPQLERLFVETQGRVPIR